MFIKQTPPGYMPGGFLLEKDKAMATLPITKRGAEKLKAELHPVSYTHLTLPTNREV